ncbi:hypothetical protein HD806DRAFT_523640 [Xylariaceae sp. AK1471]|nr:hypothetical protein HD806DRAFT_523640 [Xylariaceae sp. AK1471]
MGYEDVNYQQLWRGRRAWLLTGFNLILFITSVLLSVQRQYKPVTEPENSWLRESTRYSPLWGTVVEGQLTKHEQKFDGSLFASSHASPYRNSLKPSEDVDKVWEDLEWIRTFPITADDVVKIGKDPITAVKFPPEYGFGDDAYVGTLDIFHQLHCLNVLRKLAWEEFDRDGKTAKQPYEGIHWLYVGHCAEILRENVMCNANLDVYTFQWKETQVQPYPDFDLNKKCTDLNILVDWQEKNALPTKKSINFTRPHGAQQVPMEDEFYRMFGLTKVDLADHRDWPEH